MARNKLKGFSILLAYLLSYFGSAQTVTLEFYTFFSTESESKLEIIDTVNDLFMAEYPNIKIEHQGFSLADYDLALNAKFLADTPPDLFLLFPGSRFRPYAEAGFLLPLSDQGWRERLLTAAESAALYKGEVYGLPLDSNVIAVFYNKTLFEQLQLIIPTTWDEFVYLCYQLKSSGITPLAGTFRSPWTIQLIPYAMAPSAIYKDIPNFDARMTEGEVSFQDSAWSEMLADFLTLQEQGFFQDGVFETDHSIISELMTSDGAAMVVQGSWLLADLQRLDPDKEWGMFPLPYSQAGENHVAMGVGAMLAASVQSPHHEAIKIYIDFWARPDIATLYLEDKQAFPALIDVEPSLEKTLVDFLPYLSVGSYSFLDLNWPEGVQAQMLQNFPALLNGEMTIDDFLLAMDAAFKIGMTLQRD